MTLEAYPGRPDPCPELVTPSHQLLYHIENTLCQTVTLKVLKNSVFILLYSVSEVLLFTKLLFTLVLMISIEFFDE